MRSLIVPVSAATGEGVEHLERVLPGSCRKRDPPGRHHGLAERVLWQRWFKCASTPAELPFATAVVVDQFDESEWADSAA